MFKIEKIKWYTVKSQSLILDAKPPSCPQGSHC